MVGAAIPVGNMDLFQNAIADEKIFDRYDNSQEYQNYYSDNENKYRPNYDNNNYYQQQQPQPSYSNNYGYNDNKKISHDNSYDKDNTKYSKYPTKDKKYVCQTGQFAGLFVESVEFCFKKTHDRDEKRGDGEEGAPGPTALFQINAITTNKVVLLLP